MTRASTLPSTREQARHALLLLGAPAPARLVAAAHGALFDGDLDVPALAGLLRSERQAAAPVVCQGLSARLAPLHLALAEWPLERRIVTAQAARAAVYRAVIRVTEFAALRPAAARGPGALLRSLAADVPGGCEAADLAAAAREALAALGADPEFERSSALAAALDPYHQLFGVASLPHQRDGR